ncbi:hypothetical protein [uncultured Roseovarius sp.]|nr:hypothetical protein [uncultured Roseovarius sp.]
MARLIFAVSFLLLTACADEEHYPLSGEECNPDDPVRGLDASDFDCPPRA